jgi:hypothetical protein
MKISHESRPNPKPSNLNRFLAVPADQVGIWASALCMIHCVLTPVVLSISAVSAHFLPSDERTHRTLAILIAVVGAIALVKGYRNHRKRRVRSLMAVGLVCIFSGALWGDRLPSHLIEVCITLIGSAFMIAAHFANHTFCRNCSCSRVNRED